MGWFEDEAAVEDIASRSGLALEESDVRALASKNPEDRDQFLRDLEAQAAVRNRPTFSAGGTGGDADTDANGRLDPGWVNGRWAGGGANPSVRGLAPGQLAAGPMAYSAGGQPQSLGSFGAQSGTWNGTAGNTGTAIADGSTRSLGDAFQYKPFTEQFVAPQAPADLMEAWGKTYERPTAEALTSDPGYQARLDAQQRGMERSAAAKGTLLTGGHQRALGEYGQELASNEYQRLADRAMNEYLNAFNVFTTDKGRRSAEFGNTYNRALGEFGQRFDIDRSNQSGGLSANQNQFGQFANTRDFAANRSDTAFNQMDANRGFAANRDDTMWNRNRTGYLDADAITYRDRRDPIEDDLRLADYGSRPR